MHSLGKRLEGGGGVGRCAGIVAEHDGIGVRAYEGNLLVGSYRKKRGLGRAGRSILHEHDALPRSLQRHSLVFGCLKCGDADVPRAGFLLKLAKGETGLEHRDECLVDILLGEVVAQ